MGAERLAERLKETLERLPKEGLVASKVVGLVSRLTQLVYTVGQVISEAKCVAKARGDVRGEGGASQYTIYTTSCAGIIVLEDEGVSTVWKIGSHAFAAKLASREVMVENKYVGVTIMPEEVRVRIASNDGKKEIAVKLADAQTIYAGYHKISYALKRLESHLRAAQKDLAACERSAAIQC